MWKFCGNAQFAEFRETSRMECFVIIDNGWKPLTIITKCSILDVARNSANCAFPQNFHRSKHCGNYTFSQNFHTRKLDEITVFYAVGPIVNNVLKVYSQVWVNWMPSTNYEKRFLFHLKSSFRSQDISIFVLTFLYWHLAKRLVRKLRLFSNFVTSQPG